MFYTSFFTGQTFLIILWLVIFLLALIIEFADPTFVSIWFCGGAIVSMILAIFEVTLWVQISSFLIVSAVLFGLSRFLFKGKTLEFKKIPTNVDAMAGQEVLLLTAADHDHLGTGIVREITWTVKVNDSSQFKKDEIAIIEKLDGNKLIIIKKERK